ncbi:four helix bundle protein [Salinibacter ruber]|nr:four helix bundle protein [Salinibacter ruber]MCS4150745.1 four helix bundle protein [Salinibacter ruber]
MAYKFEQLDVWQRALEYTDQVHHEIADQLPKHERYNLRDEMTRAANSIALNIGARRLLLPFGQGAEGSTGSSDAEQGRFLQIAIRLLLESVACLHLVKRRGYADDVETLRKAYRESEPLFAQLQAFRSSIDGESSVQEDIVGYDDGAPF